MNLYTLLAVSNGLLFGVAVVGTWLLVCAVAQYLRERKSRAIRKGWTRADFVDYFRSSNVAQEVSAGVYDGLPRFQMILRDFPVHPDDDLDSVYGVGGQYGISLREFIDEIAPSCGVAAPTESQLTAFVKGGAPIVTVSDLVRFMSRLRDNCPYRKTPVPTEKFLRKTSKTPSEGAEGQGDQ